MCVYVCLFLWYAQRHAFEDGWERLLVSEAGYVCVCVFVPVVRAETRL
jgi:hypothetical protein